MASSRRGVLGLFKADGHVALRGEVVDLIGLNLLNDANQIGAVGQVAVVQNETLILLVRVLVEVIDAVCIEERGAALDAVHLIALGEQQL
jgi:hypothetical protein